MTKTEQQLENEIITIQNKIIDGGRYIATVCRRIPAEGIIAFDDGVVITDPVGEADEILETAYAIKKLAVQYQALIKLKDKAFQNKKAVNSEDSLATDSL